MKLTYNETEVQRALEQATWQSWTPKIGYATSSRPSTFSLNRAVYLRVRDIVYYTVSFSATSTTGDSPTYIEVEIPPTGLQEENLPGVGRKSSGGGFMLWAYPVDNSGAPGDLDGNVFRVGRYNGTLISISSGDQWVVSGSYLS